MRLTSPGKKTYFPLRDPFLVKGGGQLKAMQPSSTLVLVTSILTEHPLAYRRRESNSEPVAALKRGIPKWLEDPQLYLSPRLDLSELLGSSACFDGFARGPRQCSLSISLSLSRSLCVCLFACLLVYVCMCVYCLCQCMCMLLPTSLKATYPASKPSLPCAALVRVAEAAQLPLGVLECAGAPNDRRSHARL